MKIILILLILGPYSYANSFRLHTTSSRFELVITKTELKYTSELVQRNLVINKCSRPHVIKLNGEMLHVNAEPNLKSYLDYEIDKHKIKVSSDSVSGKKLLSMDQKILHFFDRVREKCK